MKRANGDLCRIARMPCRIHSVGDGPRVAKHVYTLVDLIGTPAPRVTVEDLVVRKAQRENAVG